MNRTRHHGYHRRKLHAAEGMSTPPPTGWTVAPNRERRLSSFPRRSSMRNLTACSAEGSNTRQDEWRPGGFFALYRNDPLIRINVNCINSVSCSVTDERTSPYIHYRHPQGIAGSVWGLLCKILSVLCTAIFCSSLSLSINFSSRPRFHGRTRIWPNQIAA